MKRWSVSALLNVGDTEFQGTTRRRSGTDPTGYTAVMEDEDEDYYDWRGTGWEDDYQTEAAEDDMFSRVHNGMGGVRDLEGKKMAHRFSAAEELRMAKFESIDYWNPNTRMYRNNLERIKKRGRGSKWMVYALIGIVVGMFSFVMMNTIEFLSKKRRSTLEDAFSYGPSSTSEIWKAYFVWLLFSMVCVILSTVICGFWPYAAGSGVPDVMAYLNGVTFPKVFNLRTLIGKLMSCSLAVAGGLPVGPEGPMIHIGALIGAGLGTGRSRTLGRAIGWIGKFRNPRDHRDFITGGAAAGVACAFSAPIGGLLFVVEEMSSNFSKRAMWMSFFASLMAIVVANSLNSKFSGWELRGDNITNCTHWANWNADYTILFKTNVLENVNILSIPFTLVLGVICGLLGALFTFCNIKVSRFRMQRVNKTILRRMAEPVCILILFTSLSYLAVYSLDCEKKPVGVQLAGELEYFDAICKDDTEYHPLGTLVFASADDAVRLLFRREPQDERISSKPEHALKGDRIFGYSTLIIWLILYLTFACWSAGTHLACGLVVPMLIMGASIGRIYGLAVVDLMQTLMSEDCTGVDSWVDPGVFALFGAAGFFGGVSRLTFSLCVIMLEITGDLPHLPNLMLCVMVAKSVADFVTHALYHAILELKCVPFLDWDIHLPYLDCYTAKDLILANPTPPVTLQTRDTVGNIMKVLSGTPHNAFPIVSESPYGGNLFRGTILRSQLEQMLWYLHEVEMSPGKEAVSIAGLVCVYN